MAQPYVPMGGGTAASIAEQRYAALRLQQAVRAGLVPASVLNAHPNAYPAIWRMVSQKVGAAAQGAGYKDPGYWLRMGGPNAHVGGQGGVDTSQVPAPATLSPQMVAAAQGMPPHTRLGGAVPPGAGAAMGLQLPPGFLAQLAAQFAGAAQQQPRIPGFTPQMVDTFAGVGAGSGTQDAAPMGQMLPPALLAQLLALMAQNRGVGGPQLG